MEGGRKHLPLPLGFFSGRRLTVAGGRGGRAAERVKISFSLVSDAGGGGLAGETAENLSAWEQQFCIRCL